VSTIDNSAGFACGFAGAIAGSTSRCGRKGSSSKSRRSSSALAGPRLPRARFRALSRLRHRGGLACYYGRTYQQRGPTVRRVFLSAISRPEDGIAARGHDVPAVSSGGREFYCSAQIPPLPYRFPMFDNLTLRPHESSVVRCRARIPAAPPWRGLACLKFSRRQTIWHRLVSSADTIADGDGRREGKPITSS